MLRFLALLLVPAGILACGFAMPAAPPYAMGGPTLPPGPDMPSTIDPAYCGSPGADLLASLEGSWSLQQGGGVAWGKTDGGSIGIPLPGHDPAPVVFEYVPELGVMHVRSPDSAEEMTLVLRFSDAGNASGMIYFEGTGKETEYGAGVPTETSSEFRAGAPVKLSR